MWESPQDPSAEEQVAGRPAVGASTTTLVHARDAGATHAGLGIRSPWMLVVWSRGRGLSCTKSSVVQYPVDHTPQCLGAEHDALQGVLTTPTMRAALCPNVCLDAA